MRTNAPRSQSGFTLVEIMIVVAIVGLLAAMALPNFLETRTIAQKNVCINNLRQIDTALQHWALEYKKAGNSPVTLADIADYLDHAVICPTGGKATADSYIVTTVSAGPGCNKVPGTHLLPWATLASKPPPTDPGGSTSGSGGGGGTNDPPTKKPPGKRPPQPPKK